MSGPTPVDLVQRDLAMIASLVRVIEASYPWAFSLGYNPERGEQTRHQKGNVSDPTLSTATGSRYVTTRSKTATAARLVGDALRALQGAENALLQLLDAGDRVIPFPDEEKIADLLPKAELREAHRAQKRRAERGEATA